MFVSQPQYKFPVPPGLANPGAQHWRIVELTLHAPWFLLSVEVDDATIPDSSMIRTLCIAWDNDLADVLGAIDAARVVGIICMMPAWQSSTGQWASREVREVWRSRSAAGISIFLRDAAGERFDSGFVLDHTEPIQHELLLRVSAVASRKRSKTQSNRNARRAPKSRA
jgi:hypothetical protein